MGTNRSSQILLVDLNSSWYRCHSTLCCRGMALGKSFQLHCHHKLLFSHLDKVLPFQLIPHLYWTPKGSFIYWVTLGNVTNPTQIIKKTLISAKLSPKEISIIMGPSNRWKNQSHFLIIGTFQKYYRLPENIFAVCESEPVSDHPYINYWKIIKMNLLCKEDPNKTFWTELTELT